MISWCVDGNIYRTGSETSVEFLMHHNTDSMHKWFKNTLLRYTRPQNNQTDLETAYLPSGRTDNLTRHSLTNLAGYLINVYMLQVVFLHTA